MIRRRSFLAGLPALPLLGASSVALAAELPVVTSLATTDGDVLAATILNLDVPYLAIGGNFTTVTTGDGTHKARNLAVINTVNGRLVYAGQVDGYVHAIGAVNSTMFIGGRFNTVNGQYRKRVAAISTDNWALKPWQAYPSVSSGIVTAIAYTDRLLYLGSSNEATAYDQRSGDLVWQLSTAGGPVRALLAWHGTNRLYVGGLFHALGGNVQDGLQAVRMDTGQWVPAFAPKLRPATHVGPSGNYDGQHPISLAADLLRGRLVAGIASVHVNGLMSFDMAGAKCSDVPTAGDCQAVAVVDGGRAYFGGWHNSNPAATNPQMYAGLWSPDTSSWLPWDGPTGRNVPSDDGGNGGVQAVAVCGPNLYAAGAFTQPFPSLATYRIAA